MWYWNVERVEDLKKILGTILREGRQVKVRGLDYREILGAAIEVPGIPDLEELASEFPYFSPYLAAARTEYILATFDDEISDAVGELNRDKYSRRAYLITPDWFWEGHDPCIMAMQVLIRDSTAYGFVFMRSSDFFNAFPYDWCACSQLLCEIAERSSLDDENIGTLTFLISSLHIREVDVEKICRFLTS